MVNAPEVVIPQSTAADVLPVHPYNPDGTNHEEQIPFEQLHPEVQRSLRLAEVEARARCAIRGRL